LRSRELPSGARVRVAATRDIGSESTLNGETAVVLGPHPIARNWVKIRIERDGVEWPIPKNQLIQLNVVAIDTGHSLRCGELQPEGLLDALGLKFCAAKAAAAA
jgi:hypothetical protein